MVGSEVRWYRFLLVLETISWTDFDDFHIVVGGVTVIAIAWGFGSR